MPTYGATTITIPSNPPVEITGTTQQAAVNTRYIANNSSRITITLPATAALGDQTSVRGKGVGGWRVSQNASQIIHGASDTTTGTGGYIQSQTFRDTVALECTTPNLEWTIISNRGTLDIV